MEYIVKSRGRTIGTTDLGFVRTCPGSRIGWFTPNDAGDRVMPEVTAVLPAVRAFLCNDGRHGYDGPVPWAELATSTAYADLAAAIDHVGALDLTLHREDGTVIPTEHVGIRDTKQLIELARIDDAMLGIDDPEIEADPRERYQIIALLADGIDLP